MLLQYKHFTTPDMESFIPPNQLEEQIKFQMTYKIAEALYNTANYETEHRDDGNKVRSMEVVTLPPNHYKQLVVLAKKLWYEEGNPKGFEMLHLLQADKVVS